MYNIWFFKWRELWSSKRDKPDLDASCHFSAKNSRGQTYFWHTENIIFVFRTKIFGTYTIRLALPCFFLFFFFYLCQVYVSLREQNTQIHWDWRTQIIMKYHQTFVWSHFNQITLSHTEFSFQQQNPSFSADVRPPFFNSRLGLIEEFVVERIYGIILACIPLRFHKFNKRREPRVLFR